MGVCIVQNRSRPLLLNWYGGNFEPGRRNHPGLGVWQKVGCSQDDSVKRGQLPGPQS